MKRRGQAPQQIIARFRGTERKLSGAKQMSEVVKEPRGCGEDSLSRLTGYGGMKDGEVKG
jgi:hypothetical protein